MSHRTPGHASVLILGGLAALSACAGSSARIQPIPPDGPAFLTRIELKETYVFNVGVTLYVLPYGQYLADGQDDKGIYYRAPIPIVTRGWLGTESFVEGGLYVPTDVTWAVSLVWLYVREDSGAITMELMPSGFGLTYGERWFRETTGAAQ